MVQYNHIVVGAGINGCWAALQLARRGAKVLIIEKFPLPHSRGSSHGQSRGIRRAYPDPFFTKLMEEAYREWHQIEEQTGVKLIKETGLLCFADNMNQFIQSIVNSFQKNPDAASKTLDSNDFRKDYPYIRLADTARGCYDPTGGVIMADKALRCVQDLCRALGVDIRDGDGAEDIQYTSQGVQVTTATGKRYSAESCIICTGPWAGALLNKLGYRIPLTPIKIPVYYWEAGPHFIPHTWIFEGDEGHIWGLPSLEYPGLVKICPHDGPEIDPDQRDSVSTQHLKTKITNFIRDRFPGVNPEVRVEESCIYTLSPDWNPVIDVLPGTHNRILVAVGFSGTGFKLGPVTGRMLADLAQGVKPRQEVPLLSLDRFRSPKL